MPAYKPPFTISNTILSLTSKISESIGHLSANFEREQSLRLRKINNMRTIQGSLAIEGNTLSIDQITAIVEGKKVLAPVKEVKEAHNAISAYSQLLNWQPHKSDNLLQAHETLMMALVPDAGCYRKSGVGVMSGDKVVHMAPQAERVPQLMSDLLGWLKETELPPLIASCIFHYEFEFIHPFTDGNGRLGRLWQTLILSKWQKLFVNLPVESVIYENQHDYYQAIRQSTAQTDCALFVTCMLKTILQTINALDDDGTSDGISVGINKKIY